MLFVSFLYQILTVTHQRARRDTIFLPKCRQEIRIGKKSARCTYFLRGHISLLQHPFCQRQAVTEQIFGKGYSHTGMKYGRKIRFRQSCLLRRIRQPDFFAILRLYHIYFVILSFLLSFFPIHPTIGSCKGAAAPPQKNPFKATCFETSERSF